MGRLKLQPNDILKLGNCKYVISKVIEGGNALVYEANNSETRAKVIIKEIYPIKQSSLDTYREAESNVLRVRENGNKHLYDEAISRFQKEITMLERAGAECFQVAAPFHVVEGESGYGISSSFSADLLPLEGWISSEMNENFSDLDRVVFAIKATRTLLSGLSNIHENAGLLHLDISTNNLFIGVTGGNPVIFFLDFGCAAEYRNGVPINIDHNMTTKAFAAPERLPNFTNQDVYPSTDLYSVAMVLLHLIVRYSAACPRGTIDNIDYPEDLVSNGFCYLKDYIYDLNVPISVKTVLFSFFKGILCSKPVERVFQSAREMSGDDGTESIGQSNCDECTKTNCDRNCFNLIDILRICQAKGIHPLVIAQKSQDKYNALYNPERFQEQLLSPTYRTINLNQNTLLIGDGGSGKTTLMIKKWGEMLERFWKNRAEAIPIWITLSQFDSTKTYIRRQIASYIDLTDSYEDDYLHRVEQLLQKYKFILFFDGLNEAMNPTSALEELGRNEQGEQIFRNCILIVSTRTTYELSLWKRFVTVPIEPLDAVKTVPTILKSKGKVYNSLSKRLQYTLLRPMFLALYLKLVVDKVAFEEVNLSAINTPGEILLAHIRRMINIRSDIHINRIEALEFYLMDLLPWIAHSVRQMHLTAQQAEDVVMERIISVWRGKLRYWKVAANCFVRMGGEIVLDPGVALDMFENTYISMGLFEKTSTGYAFSHENYRDFFEALYVQKEMGEATGDAIPSCLGDGLIPANVTSFLGDIICNNDGMREYMFEGKTAWGSPPSSPIENFLHAHCERKNERSDRIAIRNLIEIMKLARNNHITADYSNLDLTLVNFYGCWLPCSCFTNSFVQASAFLLPIPNDALSCSWFSVLPSQKELVYYAIEKNSLYYFDAASLSFLREIEITSGHDYSSGFDLYDDPAHDEAMEHVFASISDVEEKYQMFVRMTPDHMTIDSSCASAQADYCFGFVKSPSGRYIAFQMEENGSHFVAVIDNTQLKIYKRPFSKKYGMAKMLGYSFTIDEHCLLIVANNGEITKWSWCDNCAPVIAALPSSHTTIWADSQPLFGSDGLIVCPSLDKQHLEDLAEKMVSDDNLSTYRSLEIDELALCKKDLASRLATREKLVNTKIQELLSDIPSVINSRHEQLAISTSKELPITDICFDDQNGEVINTYEDINSCYYLYSSQTGRFWGYINNQTGVIAQCLPVGHDNLLIIDHSCHHFLLYNVRSHKSICLKNEMSVSGTRFVDCEFDGKKLLVNLRRIVCVWDTVTKQQILLYTVPEVNTGFATFEVTLGESGVFLWDAGKQLSYVSYRSGQLEQTLLLTHRFYEVWQSEWAYEHPHPDVIFTAFSKDGRFLYRCLPEGTVYVLDFGKKKAVNTGDTLWNWFYKLSGEERKEVLLSVNGASFEKNVSGVRRLQQMKLVASDTDELIADFSGTDENVGYVTYLSMDRSVFLTRHNQNRRNILRVYRYNTLDSIIPVSSRGHAFSNAIVSPDNALVAVTSSSGEVRVWEAKTGKAVFTWYPLDARDISDSLFNIVWVGHGPNAGSNTSPHSPDIVFSNGAKWSSFSPPELPSLV